uniref:Uncharacterized protein n=1 Tax=Rhizophora mucronata TaxID=61149 RepID=A0A2P2NWM4_RHIMU
MRRRILGVQELHIGKQMLFRQFAIGSQDSCGNKGNFYVAWCSWDDKPLLLN